MSANVTIPEEDKIWLDEHARGRGFGSADEYARFLVAEERASRWWAEQSAERQESIQAHIEEGWRQSEAGESIDPEDLRQELIRRSASARSRQ